ncbi:MAG: alpha/beta hydrolase, partial [Bacteroidota bacterium]
FGGLAATHFLENVSDNEEKKLVLIAPASEMKIAIDQFFAFLELDKEVRKEFDELIFKKTGNRPEHYSIRRALKNIRSSILWIHDKTDDITPVSDALDIKKEKYPNIRFIFTNGLGHRKIYRDEEVVRQVAEFL